MARIHAVIDDELLVAAEEACPDAPTRTALLEEALRALIERNAARDLARMVRDGAFSLSSVRRRLPDEP